MKFTSFFAAALLAVSIGSAPAYAAETVVVVTPSNPQGWSNPPGENSVTGSAAITSTAPRSGNGSVELTGDRSRFIMGNAPGANYNPASNLFTLDQVASLSFDYMIDPASSRTDYSPSVRFHLWDGAQRSELIFEQVYNGPFAPAGTWVTTDSSDVFWRFVTGSGTTLNAGSQVNMTLADWAASSYFSNDAYVSAISVGQGSSATPGYKAYADNVRVSFTNGDSTLYNFETAAVPEPATWAMMIMGFGGMGALVRRRKSMVATA